LVFFGNLTFARQKSLVKLLPIAMQRSSETAEHEPDYRELGRFPTLAKAEEFLASVEAD